MAEVEIPRPERNIDRKSQPAAPQVQAKSKPTSDIAAGPQRPASQLDQAISEFDRHDEATIIEMLMKHVGVLLIAREHRLAINILRNVLMRSPENQEALRCMGIAHREEGRYDEALKCFRAFAKALNSSEAQFLIAETYYLGERDEMALASYREAMKLVIEDPRRLFETYKNVGNIYVRAGDYESAEEFYNKAYTINSQSDLLMVNYGTLEIQRENLGAAVERFRSAVAINSNNDKAWVGLALVHRQMGDHELAWANVQRALDINMSNRTAIRLVVDWSVQDQNFSVAISRLQLYLAREGEDAEMSFTLAKIFTHVGRLREARVEMERALALDPGVEGGEALAKILDQEIVRMNQAAESN
jgi:Flp pilus assembly protein TadD